MDQVMNSYLTFSVGNNIFGIHVEKVEEIKEYISPKAVPESLPFVKGVIDHRDEVIPVIDAAQKFNLGKIEISPQTCIVVLEIEKESGDLFKIGVLVDNVSDVFESDPEKIKEIEEDYKPGYISATYRTEDLLVMILNANKVFSDTDIVAMDKMIGEFN
ncbi:MAG: purine-binding chemotaxis protein CheW [Marinilabiliaceae bacterium]|nr:purine-binding chemotaxis protein CheW [Marinilabiliaceae bacterium]